MSTDPFSDILRFVRVETLVTGGFTAGGCWALRFPPPDKIKFFAVVKGTCWVRLDGEPQPLRFATGDVGLITVKRSFVLGSDPDGPAVDAMSVFSRPHATTTQFGDGRDFAHLGGHVLLDPASGHLLADVLPPWIHIPAALPQAATIRWLLEQLVAEHARDLPGTQLASAQLAQLLFLQILRVHLETTDARPVGWLRALSDPRLAPALRLMHGDPGRPWQLGELAQACAMSRTTFAFHFKANAGMAPLTYLTAWRMQLAQRALREGSAPVKAIAESLGYTSESAFSHAFKRITGTPPKTCRTASTPIAREAQKRKSVFVNL